MQITYEKINDPYSSFGADIFLNFNDTNTSRSWSDNFAVTPFYRFYFFDKRDFGGSGFFAEVFSKFSFGESDVEYYYGLNNPNIDPYTEIIEEDFFDVAIGASIGQKWVNKKGWTFELSLGFGRYLFVKDPEQLLGGPHIDSLDLVVLGEVVFLLVKGSSKASTFLICLANQLETCSQQRKLLNHYLICNL